MRMNLSLFVILPVVTVFIITLCRNGAQARMAALAGAGVQALMAVLLTFLYLQSGSSGILFEERYAWFPSLGIEYHVGVDGISVAMILLTSMVLFSGMLVSWNVTERAKEFFGLLTFLGAGAFGFFISLDLFTLFLFFEMAVVPKYLLIGIWGSGKKEYAAMKLVLMLMGGSALVALGILGLYAFSGNPGTFDLAQLAQTDFPYEVQMILFPLLFAGFGVLSALFPFHTWAPDGHSSAPTAASMFLAGISMKLGGYGCLKIAVGLLPAAAAAYSGIILILALAGILYGALATAWQQDLKMMNAYSSVSHCGFVLLGAGMLNPAAMNGAVLQMVSHGLMTALFFAVIGMIYDRTHNRLAQELGGLLKVMPFIGTAFFLAGLASLGLPGLSGFVAEITVFLGSFENGTLFQKTVTVLATLSLAAAAVYILRAAGFSMMGPLNEKYASLKDASWNERIAAILLIAGIVGMGVFPGWLSAMTGGSVRLIWQNAFVHSLY